MFRTMRDVGFLNRVRQTAAFCQLLAMSSWHSMHMLENHSSREHLKYSLVATQELQKVISQEPSTSEDTIAGTLAFVCCANLLHDSESFNIHLDGLKSMLDQRGGIETLNSNPLLRIMLFWYHGEHPVCDLSSHETGPISMDLFSKMQLLVSLHQNTSYRGPQEFSAVQISKELHWGAARRYQRLLTTLRSWWMSFESKMRSDRYGKTPSLLGSIFHRFSAIS
jgi:hypothetical protein